MIGDKQQYDGAQKHYHVCFVLKRLVRSFYSCATGGGEVWITEDNIDIFKSIGLLLGKILLMNQKMTYYIGKKRKFKDIKNYIKAKYSFDDIWMKGEEILDKPIEYSNKLSSYYRQIYELLIQLKLDDSSKMVNHAMNGLILGLFMEAEIMELYDEPDIFDIMYNDGLKKIETEEFCRLNFFEDMNKHIMNRMNIAKGLLREVTEFVIKG